MTISTLLFVYLFLIVVNIVKSDDISVDDLKLLESYKLRHLRDFVRGKGRGFVSKVSLEDLLNSDDDTSSEDFFDQQQSQRTSPEPSVPQDETENMDPDDPDVVALGGMFDMNIENDPNIKTIQLGPPDIRPMKKLRPGEHLVIPHIITPTTRAPRLRTEAPRLPENRRQQGQSQKASSQWKEMTGQGETQRRPDTQRQNGSPQFPVEQPSNQDFEELARILKHFRQSQRQQKEPELSNFQPPRPTPEPPIDSYTIATEAPTTSRTRPGLRRFGLPIIIEQENDPVEFPQFVVSPLSDRWKGVAEPISTTTAAPLTPASVRPHLFGGINLRPSKMTTGAPDRNGKSATSFLIGDSGPAPLAAGDLIPISEEEWESKMRQISRKLGNYLLAVKKKKEDEGTLARGSYQVNAFQSGSRNQQVDIPVNNVNNLAVASRVLNQRNKQRAFVTILREGIMHQISQNQFSLVASITLIRDGGKNILVDTGLATDINGKTDLLQKLSRLNIVPPKVDYVITTHGHPDHSNINDFPDSVHIQGNFIHHRTKFNISEIGTTGFINLTPNVRIIKAPGHTSEDLSVIVGNTDKYGTIAVSGDIFMTEKDIDYPMIWKKFSSDPPQQEKSRKELICLANYIIPGHGKIFKVTQSMKNGVNCRTNDIARRRFNKS